MLYIPLLAQNEERMDKNAAKDPVKYEMLKTVIADRMREISPRTSGPTALKPLPAAKIELPAEAMSPEATESILNAQLLECVALMRDAGWFYRNAALEPAERGHFSDQTVRLMTASGEIAKVVALLRGRDEPASRQHYLVEHVNRAAGVGGPMESKNE